MKPPKGTLAAQKHGSVTNTVWPKSIANLSPFGAKAPLSRSDRRTDMQSAGAFALILISGYAGRQSLITMPIGDPNFAQTPLFSPTVFRLCGQESHHKVIFGRSVDAIRIEAVRFGETPYRLEYNKRERR
jgi:hypothetical protein